MAVEKHKCDGYDCNECWNDEDDDDSTCWKEAFVKKGLGALLIFGSMVGLYNNIEYSGWVMFAGIMLVL